MLSQRFRDRTISLMLLTLLATCFGCYSSDVTTGVAIHGLVTFQGEPIAKGMITFSPPFNVSGRGGSSPIIQGRYFINREDGPSPGNLEVRILSLEQVKDEYDNSRLTTVISSQIPQKYNFDTQLQIAIPDRKSMYYRFDLK